MSTPLTTAAEPSKKEEGKQEKSKRRVRFIPSQEQDEDLWRFGYWVPGRDPVTQLKGL